MIKEFMVATSKTVNLGNFNSIRIEASITVAMAEGDDYVLVRRRAQEDLTQLLKETYAAQRKGGE